MTKIIDEIKRFREMMKVSDSQNRINLCNENLPEKYIPGVKEAIDSRTFGEYGNQFWFERAYEADLGINDEAMVELAGKHDLSLRGMSQLKQIRDKICNMYWNRELPRFGDDFSPRPESLLEDYAKSAHYCGEHQDSFLEYLNRFIESIPYGKLFNPESIAKTTFIERPSEVVYEQLRRSLAKGETLADENSRRLKDVPSADYKHGCGGRKSGSYPIDQGSGSFENAVRLLEDLR